MAAFLMGTCHPAKENRIFEAHRCAFACIFDAFKESRRCYIISVHRSKDYVERDAGVRIVQLQTLSLVYKFCERRSFRKSRSPD
jgi:hypothetical protein